MGEAQQGSISASSAVMMGQGQGCGMRCIFYLPPLPMKAQGFPQALLEAAWRLLSKRLLGRSAYLACTGHEIPIQGSNDDALLGTQ